MYNYNFFNITIAAIPYQPYIYSTSCRECFNPQCITRVLPAESYDFSTGTGLCIIPGD